MGGGTGDAVLGVGLDDSDGVVVRAEIVQELGAEHPFRDVGVVVALVLGGREFREVVHRRKAQGGAMGVDDLAAHEGTDAHVAVGAAAHAVLDHGVDAHEGRPGGDLDRAFHRARAAEDVREVARATTGDGDLVHDAAGRADDLVLGKLAELGQAGLANFQIKVGLEATQNGDFRGCAGADADVHGHVAQQEEAEAEGKLDALFLEQREDAAADVGGPGA